VWHPRIRFGPAHARPDLLGELRRGRVVAAIGRRGGQRRLGHLGFHGSNRVSGFERGECRLQRRRRRHRRDLGAERVAQPLDGARVQLRDPRFVHAQLRANVLHGHFVVVVERDDALFSGRQRGNGVADARLHLVTLVLQIGALGLGRHHDGWQLRFVDVLGAREGRGGLNGVDANDGLAQALFVRADLFGQVGQRRLVTERGA